jgi:uncharacterized protein (TIGR02757 family)
MDSESRREPLPGPGRTPELSGPALLSRLRALERSYDRRWLGSDPVGIVRRYDRPDDRELVGLLAAGLAYGRVASIRVSLERLLSRLGPSPSRFLESYDPRRDAARFDGFAHRFTRGRDVALLLWLVRQARERSAGLESFFLEADPDPLAETLEQGMNAFGERLFTLDARPFHPDGRVPRGDGARWLLPIPRDGSACKRHCLWLRWMVRPDDGVDCGVWKRVAPSRLVLPLDVHLQRVARALDWTRRRSPGWRMALEVTAHLRRIDPGDPARYDFALSRLGILGRVRARDGRLSRRELDRVFDEVAGTGGTA